jgi:hypothetical protein
MAGGWEERVVKKVWKQKDSTECKLLHRDKEEDQGDNEDMILGLE